MTNTVLPLSKPKKQQKALSQRPELPSRLKHLKGKLAKLERRGKAQKAVLTFGVPDIDRHLPWGGLPIGQVHQVLCSTQPITSGPDIMASGLGLVAALAGRLCKETPEEPIYYCHPAPTNHTPILYPPGLDAFGIRAEQLILVRARSQTDLLWAMEDALRSGIPAAVIGHIEKPTPVAVRRLQLAAERGGVIGFLVGNEKRCQGTLPTASRWRISPVPTPKGKHLEDRNAPWIAPLWKLDLLRGGGAAPKSWTVAWHSPRHQLNKHIIPIFYHYNKYLKTKSKMEVDRVLYRRSNDTQPTIKTKSAMAFERTSGAFHLASPNDHQHRSGRSLTERPLYPQTQSPDDRLKA